MGRRLPGSAPLKIARFDVETSRLIEGPDGFAEECAVGEVGMLLARLSHRDGAYPDRSLRALFEGDDAWLATGDLFLVDGDGDHWLIGGVQSLIRTPAGATPPIPVQDAVSALDEVHLSVAYPTEEADGTTAVAVAISMRPGQQADLDRLAPRLTDAVQSLAAADRPRYIRVVDEIPRTTWYRVRTGPLRAEGIPTDGSALVLDDETGAYRPRT